MFGISTFLAVEVLGFMKVGIVCHPSIGGSGLIATQLGIGLAKQGHEVHFIARSQPFKLANGQENIFFHEVEAINYPLFNDPLYTFSLTAKIVEVAEQYKLDIVHAHYSIPHSLCVYLAGEISTHKYPSVTTIHGTDATIVGQNKPLYPLNQFSINKSTCVTTVSHFQSQYISSHFDISKNIDVIYNFIDTQIFSPQKRSSKRRAELADNEEKILLHASNFRALKNTKTVIDVFAQVVKQVKAKLVLVGSGPELEENKEYCQQKGITDSVLFLGDVKHIETVIPSADCVILPSYHESFGMVLLEAMACGVPTVSSNIEGIPEVVKEDETGYMMAPDDSDAMANAVVRIFSDESLQARLGHAGRQRAINQFSWDKAIQGYIDCYQTAINKQRNNE